VTSHIDNSTMSKSYTTGIKLI